MLDLPLSMVIEGLVAVLLVITIAYCMMLNSRLKRLRADEEGLRATIAELLTATEIAERAIQGLRTTSAQCDQTITQRLQEAESMSEELATQLAAAGAVSERMGKLAGVDPKTAAAATHARRAVKAAPAGQAPNAAVAKQPAPAEAPSRRLDDAARALQDRLQRAVS